MQENIICIIEDNKQIRKLFSILLKKVGFTTVEFGDASSGIAWLKENIPSCVIVDILLPDLDGTEIVRFIKNSSVCKNVPVIAVTGYTHINDREKFLEMGFDSYIAKPVNTETFAAEIKAVIK